MERRFVANGALKEAGSIFFLNAAEITSMLSGAASGTLQSDIAIRREAFEAARQIRPELNFASAKAEEAEAGNCLRGVGVSRGLIQGKVYKVRNPLDREAYQHIPHDAIIVAPVLTPNLTYSIISCAAIVTEVGGFLSHGAIFARETGIPAIVQAAGALDWLNTGDEVIVDADQGVIHKLNK